MADLNEKNFKSGVKCVGPRLREDDAEGAFARMTLVRTPHTSRPTFYI